MPLWLLGMGFVALWWRPLLIVLAIWIALAFTLHIFAGALWESDMRAAIERDGSMRVVDIYEDHRQGGIWASLRVDNPTPYAISEINLTCDALNDDGVEIVARTVSYGSPTLVPHTRSTIALRFNLVPRWVVLDSFDRSACVIAYEPARIDDGKDDQWVQSFPM